MRLVHFFVFEFFERCLKCDLKVLSCFFNLRDLLTKINFVTADERIGNCVVAIKVYLPRGLYVDPYELASLQKHNLTEV